MIFVTEQQQHMNSSSEQLQKNSNYLILQYFVIATMHILTKKFEYPSLELRITNGTFKMKITLPQPNISG